MLNFVPANEKHSDLINKLIHDSKSHWDYQPAYLNAALELLRINADYINKYPCFVVTNEVNELVCFCSLNEDTLENLWVTPKMINQGIGRFALDQIIELAKTQGLNTLWTLPDPPAEKFYLKYGFKDSGERIPSRVNWGPTFKKYYYVLDNLYETQD